MKLLLNLARVGHLALKFPLIIPYPVLVASYLFVLLYLPVCKLRCAPLLTKDYHSWVIDTQRFTPGTQTWL